MLQRVEVPKYILQIIFNLNKEAILTIKTPFGVTEKQNINDVVKQGGILGAPICSASTAEYCEESKGILVGRIRVNALAYVDDIVEISTNKQDASTAHTKAINFAKRKKLRYSVNKCKTMLINGKKGDMPPELYVEDNIIENVSNLKYLGDIFNCKGNNTDLIEDRIKRGTIAMINIEALMLEVQLGRHTIRVHLLLYNSLFIPSILFNSQAWSNLTEKETNKLQAIQIKFLKKVMRAPSSMCNAFTFLELGIMPIKYEIHRRQLLFLHHIISLGGDDPVRKLLNNMKSLPGQNCWWSNVSKLQKSYSVEMSDEQIATMTKEAYRRIVNKSVKKVAFRNLVRECKEKSKTKDLQYNSLEVQDYIKTMYPTQVKTIFKCRSKTLDIKSH